MDRHLVVVGLMGSGKTTVGQALAEALGRRHRDSDADIERRSGRTAREIAATDGVEHLHGLELEHLRDAIAAADPSVISAAASVIDEPEGVALLQGRGVTVVWLRVDPATALQRSSRGSHRPSPEPLIEQAARRDPRFQAVADVEIDARLPVQHIVARVLAATGRGGAGPGSIPGMPDRLPLILDVDTGIDDSLALLYTAASPEADLLAVTCVSGNIDADQVGINTRAVLELAGRGDVEVAMGRKVPLVRPLETTPETHGPQGLGHAVLPEPSRPLSDRHAVDLILEEARRRPGEVMLVTLGPLTNLALAVLREPELPRLLRGYALMGGSFHGASGNTTPSTEWNIHCDPDAAKIVFRAWADAIAVDPSIPRPLALGLDVTEQARIGTDEVVRLARRAGSTPDAARGGSGASEASDPLIRYVADALRFYFEFHERYDGFYGAFIHDPLAVAAALDRSLVTTEALFVDVETRGEITTGMTVADPRRLTGRPPNCDVAVAADVPAFLDRLIERIGGLAADRSGVAR